MKAKLIILLVALSSGFILYQQNTNATPTPPSTFVSPSPKSPVYQLMEVAYLWEFLMLNFSPDMEQDGTWLDVGLRSKYAMAKKYTTLSQLEAVFGVPVFLKGPHQKEINYHSTHSFGHYNPAFIKILETTFRAALEHPNYRAVLKNVYQNYLAGMALTYKDAYYFINSNPYQLQELQKAYQEQVSNPQGTTNGSLQEEFRAYADGDYFSKSIQDKAKQLENFEADWYEKVTAPAFWLRRSIDGTSEQLFELLVLVMDNLEA